MGWCRFPEKNLRSVKSLRFVGVYTFRKKNVKRVYTYSRQPELLVVRKESLPFVCFEEKAGDEKEYMLVDARENNFLYSNIWKMQDNGEEKKKAEGKKHFKLNIGCWVSLCLPFVGELRCVRIKAVDSITQDVFDLDEIEDIREYGL